MAFKINGVVRIDNSGNAFLGIVTATDANITGVVTAGLVDAKVSEKAITEQTEGSVGDVTGADELLLYDVQTSQLLRVSVDEFVVGAGIGTLVVGFDNLTVTGVTTLATLTGPLSSGVPTVSVGASLVPSADVTYDLGSPTNQWRNLYLDGATVYLGGQALSGTATTLSYNEQPVVLSDTDGSINAGIITATELIVTGDVQISGVTTMTDHLYINDSNNLATDFNFKVQTSGNTKFGVLGNGAVLLGPSTSQPFIATQPHHSTSKKYVDDALAGNISAGIVTATQFVVNTSGPTWTSGSGTPEGSVTAPVGSLYSRTDGGAGTSLYVKESGTGNTGWVAK